MVCLKDWLEIAYYIAFIILTFMLVFYAKKTYKFQIKKSSTLLCKIAVSYNVSEKKEFVFGLEIFNDGNKTAKNIEVFVSNNKITTIDYIKPNEAYIFPLGSVYRMIGCNRVFYRNEKEINEGSPIKVALKNNGLVENFDVNTDVLFIPFSTSDDSFDKINQSLDKIANAITTKGRF